MTLAPRTASFRWKRPRPKKYSPPGSTTENLAGAEINDAKKILAFEATKLCHGEAAASQSAETARKTFEEGALADDLPTIDIAKAVLAKGVPAYDLLRQAGLATSNSEARRLIKGGGARLNDKPITDDTMPVRLDHARQ